MARLAADYLARIEAGEAPRQTSSGKAECLIVRLFVEGRLTERQCRAGFKFRQSHHDASRGAKLTHDWPKGRQGRLLPAWRVPDTEATQTARKAYTELLGPLGRLGAPILAMGVYDRSPREYGREVFQYRHIHAAAAAGLVSLIHALDILADHLGLEQS